VVGFELRDQGRGRHRVGEVGNLKFWGRAGR
jgi:hypothetical protein